MTMSSMKETLSVKTGSTPYTLAFLYPYSLDTEENNWTATERNEQSCVLWLDYQGVSALFMGDAPKATEDAIMRREKLDAFSVLNVELPSTEILKVAHHGSSDSTSLEFLQMLHAQTAVISCGKNNLYGHPSEAALHNLDTIGATVFRTDMQGSIIVTVSSAEAYKVTCENE